MFMFPNDLVADAQHSDLSKAVDSLFYKDESYNLPTHSCPYELANRFNDYFAEKIGAIRGAFPSRPERVVDHYASVNRLTDFQSFTSNDITRVISHMKSTVFTGSRTHNST